MVPRQDTTSGTHAARSTSVTSAALTGSLSIPFPFDAGAFAEALTGHLGQPVRIFPRRLPEGWACAWAGLDGLDVIAYNADWAGLAVALTAHAAGHLLLGHCGKAREGGQFASIASAAFPAQPVPVARQQHGCNEPLTRLFTEPEERDADEVSLALMERTGWPASETSGGPPASETSAGPGAGSVMRPSGSMFGCIG